MPQLKWNKILQFFFSGTTHIRNLVHHCTYEIVYNKSISIKVSWKKIFSSLLNNASEMVQLVPDSVVSKTIWGLYNNNLQFNCQYAVMEMLYVSVLIRDNNISSLQIDSGSQI